MPLRAALKIINLFLALGASLTAGAVSLSSGDEPVWAIGKAFACFLACWIVLGYLAAMLSAVIEGPGDADVTSGNAASKDG